jgi:hypothetical protein
MQSRTETLLPRRRVEKTLALEPNVAVARMESADPREVYWSTDAQEPNLAADRSDIVLPMAV